MTTWCCEPSGSLLVLLTAATLCGDGAVVDGHAYAAVQQSGAWHSGRLQAVCASLSISFC